MVRLIVRLLLLFALGVHLVNFILSVSGAAPQLVANMLSAASHGQATFQSLSTRWYPWGTQFNIQGLHWKTEQSASLQEASIEQLEIHLDVWRSLWHRSLVTRRIMAQNANFTIHQTKQALDLAKLQQWIESPSGNFYNWLQPQSHINVQNITLRLQKDASPMLTLLIPSGYWQRFALGYRGYMYMRSDSMGQMELRFELDGSPHNMHSRGGVYARLFDVNAAPLLSHLQIEGTQLAHSYLHATLWADWKYRRWQSGFAAVSMPELSFVNAQRQNARLGLSTSLVWGWPDKEHFHIQSKDLQLKWQNRSITTGELSITSSQKAKRTSYQIQTERLSLPELRELTAFMTPSPQTGATWSTQLSSALLQRPTLFLIQQKKHSYWLIDSDFSHLSITARDRIPGVENLTGHLQAQLDRGRVVLNTQTASFTLPQLFREPLPANHLTGEVAWQAFPDHLQVVAKDIDAANADGAVRAELSLHIPKQGSPEISLYGELKNGDGRATSRYLPVGIMPASLVEYLDSSIRSAEVPFAHIMLRGRLDQFPFDHDKAQTEGIFWVRAKAQHAVFSFAPDWPSIEHARSDLLFTGDRMEITAEDGQTQDIHVIRSRTEIPQLSALTTRVHIEAETQSQASDAMRYIEKSPLHEMLGTKLAGITLQGPTTTTLDLTIDIPHEGELKQEHIVAKGTVNLLGNSLWVKEAALPFEQVQGRIQFENTTIQSSELQAKLWGEPARIKLQQTSSGPSQAPTTEILLETTVHSKALREYLKLPKSLEISGKTAVSARYVEGSQQSSSTYALQIQSSLQGLTLALPPPYAKQGPEKRSLEIHLNYNEHQGDLTVDYNHMLGFRGLLKRTPQGALKLERASLQLDGQAAALPSTRGLRIHGHLPQWHAATWLSWLQPLPGSSSLPIQEIAVTSDVVDWYGIPLHQVAITSSNGRQFQFKAKEFAGSLDLKNANEDSSVVLRFLNIQLPEQNVNHTSVVQPQNIPRLHLICEQCTVNKKPLGKVVLYTKPVADGCYFSGAVVNDKHLDVAFQLSWQQQGETHSTVLDGKLQSNNVPKLLEEWGVPLSMRESSGKVDFKLNWPGKPWDWSLAAVLGQLNITLNKGYLAEVSDSKARIFSLLSLDSLSRRLMLDFSDIYKKGFFYNSIRGSFTLKDGVAHTERTLVDGAAADLMIKGRTDLINHQFDQTITVSPKIGSSIPVLIGWAINPAAGVAAYVLNKITQPIVTVISGIEYQVTGPWASPKVVELSKTKKAVPVPP